MNYHVVEKYNTGHTNPPLGTINDNPAPVGVKLMQKEKSDIA